MTGGPGKVVHISTADNSGGAARAAFRIHTGLLKLGWDSKMLTGFKVEAGREDIDCLPRQDGLPRRAFKRLVNKLEQVAGLEYLLLPWKRQFLEHPFVQDAEVVHLHNVHGGFFSHTILPDLSRQKKLVWSIHDLWPLTGHCYYPDMYECRRWKTGCGQCPGLRQDDHYPLSLDITKYLWNTKRKIYSRSKITLVAQSKWTLEQIRSSPLLGSFDVHVIPYGLDADVFRPINKETARDLLGLPQGVKILLFTAVGLSSERKGWTYLRKALLRLRMETNERVVFLTVGGSAIRDQMETGIEIIHLGQVNNDRLLTLVYNAADLYVGASLVETFGQVFLEAMACGVPVVTFNTSGVRDVVRHMETGYLAGYKDATDLARGIDLLLTDGALRERLGRHGREVVEAEYSMDLQARRFEKLYQDILRE